VFIQFIWSFLMAQQFRTEAERRATPRPVAPAGVCFTAPRGQKRSLERGVSTNNKKNPGKRCKKGG
jgi:hypothetical protein